jgi:hypothetical protein
MAQVQEHYSSFADFYRVEGVEHPALILEEIENALGSCCW